MPAPLRCAGARWPLCSSSRALSSKCSALQEVALVAIEDGQRHRDTEKKDVALRPLLRCMPPLTVTSGTRLLCSRSVNALRRSTSMRARTTPGEEEISGWRSAMLGTEGRLSALPSKKVKGASIDQTARKGETGHCVVRSRPGPVQRARRLRQPGPWTLLRVTPCQLQRAWRQCPLTIWPAQRCL